MKRGLSVLLVTASVALAGGRPHAGGTLGVCLVGKGVEPQPVLADTPSDAAALLLTKTPLCRLVEVSHPSATVTRLTPVPGVSSAQVVAALEQVQRSVTPMRSLLASVQSITRTKAGVELTGTTVDLERVLCHPAFASAPGPFRQPAADAVLTAVNDVPGGRPFVDSISLTPTDARIAERLLAQHKAHVVLGSTQVDEGPQLFVLSLVFSASLASHLRPSLEASIDRADLVRFFVRAPSGPMAGLLPPSLGGPAFSSTPLPPRPAPLAPAREVTLLFDSSADDERAIAERLQVKLQPLGYRVALKGVPRATLRSHTPADSELMLVNTLLPPSVPAALAVMFDVAGQRQRAASIPADDAKGRELAATVLPELPMWPLATRGLGVTTSREVQHLTRDALGLPHLEDVFLSVE